MGYHIGDRIWNSPVLYWNKKGTAYQKILFTIFPGDKMSLSFPDVFFIFETVLGLPLKTISSSALPVFSLVRNI